MRLRDRRVTAALAAAGMLLLTIVSGCSGGGPVGAGDRIEAARAALEEGRRGLARELLLGADPGDGSTLPLLAAACEGDFDAADACLEAFEPAARSRRRELVLLAARTAASLDRLTTALEWLEQAQARGGRDRELAVEQAKILGRLARHDEAVEVLEPFVGDDPRVLNLIGYAELLRGRGEVGAAYLERSADLAQSLGKAYAPAHYHLGLFHMSRGDLTAAREQFEAAARANPDHLEAHYQWMGVAERVQADPGPAREGFARINRARLEALGALGPDSRAEEPVAVQRIETIETRVVVDAPSFVRELPTGRQIEVACRAAAGEPARFVVTARPEQGAETVLYDAIHVSEHPSIPEWVVVEVEIPREVGEAAPVSFTVEPASTFGRLLGGDVPGAARFAEPGVLARRESRSADPRPNLLVFSLDTLRADRVGAYGYDRATSPVIDRLAAGGVVFQRAEAANTWTLPSHMSMFSGLTPLAHGVLPDLRVVRGFMHPDRKLQLRASERMPMFAQALEQAGYRTVAVTENGWVSPRFGFGAGFDVFRADVYGSLPRTLAGALSELETSGEYGPWLLFVHTYTPHHPYHAPEDFRLRWADPGHKGLAWPTARVPISDYNRFKSPLFEVAPSDVRAFADLYDGQVAWSDTLVGELVRWLEERGLERQTVVVVTSDHGEEIFERGRFDHGETLHEEVTHVPLVFWGPGQLPAGRRVGGPVSLIDLPATLMDLAGVGGALGDGTSLAPLWEDGNAVRSGRTAFAQTLDLEGAFLAAVWQGDLKYIRRELEGSVEERLFDLSSDPGETRDLASRRPADLQRLRALWVEHEAAARETQAALGVEADTIDPETLDRLKALGYAE